ncbi:MAG: PHP domain-containing protein, partial [Dehalococcoidia bacterium]|nr:PHP domain-containing protein [Dehalococcoidia bacterium]
MGLADLHLHTTASDGKLSPEKLVALAASRGLSYIAITDHDSTEGIDRALEAAKAYPRLTV